MALVTVFVGIAPEQWLASEVLRYSITRRTKAPLEYKELTHLPKDLDEVVGGNYPLFRFAIPELCNYKGRAIFLQSEAVVLSDIQELFTIDMKGHGALAPRMHPEDKVGGRYTNVMILDCEKLKHWKLREWFPQLNSDPEVYRDTVWCGPKGLATKDFGDLPEEYYHFEKTTPSTKIFHYPFIPLHPWKTPGNPHAHIFHAELKSAVEEEEIPFTALLREVQHGHIYPQLIKESGISY